MCRIRFTHSFPARIIALQSKIARGNLKKLRSAHQTYKETADLEAELPTLDVLYMTRIQQETKKSPRSCAEIFC